MKNVDLAEDLYQAGLRYLARYNSSVENLRRVLQRRVMRLNRRAEPDSAPLDPPAATEAIEHAVGRIVALGLVDDAAYTEAQIRRLRRQGDSAAKITARLTAKGVDRAMIDEALHNDDGSREEQDLQAARVYARRRRLGPYRIGPWTPDQHRRDLAAMCRAGFTLDIARQAFEFSDKIVDYTD